MQCVYICMRSVSIPTYLYGRLLTMSIKTLVKSLSCGGVVCGVSTSLIILLMHTVIIVYTYYSIIIIILYVVHIRIPT